MNRKVFGTMPSGRVVESVTLKNRNKLELEVLTFGCRIRRLMTKDRKGNFSDIVLGFDTLNDYISTFNFQGAVIGRFANRISNAEFTLDGITYKLQKMVGEHTLHGGIRGFFNRIWDIEKMEDCEEPYVTFTYLSEDMEEGYPGALKVTVTYTLTNEDALKIEYRAMSDKRTPFNITNHSYFNLSGDLSQNILDHTLFLDADGYAESSEALIPTGKILPVDGTPFDFRAPKAIGKDIFQDEKSLTLCGGYDHTYVLNGNGLRRVGTLYCPKSGRKMEIHTDLPSMQLFTDNSVDSTVYKNGVKCCAHQAICLETQQYPDAPNRPEFPSAILDPKREFVTTTIYKFIAE